MFPFRRCISISYSQDGEDAVLASFYEGKSNYKGFYIDIGAHHPVRFSNTQLFYEKGWRGINIDATPGSMKSFNKFRKRDINIEVGISDVSGEMEYFSFEEPALNSFDKILSEKRINDGWRLKEKIRIHTLTINTILEKHILSNNQKIDFITIDVEGMELKILKSLDFQKYAPDYFLVEDLETKSFVNDGEPGGGGICHFLKKFNYIPVAKTQRTFIFERQ
jgi:FkbM family methyltransferase